MFQELIHLTGKPLIFMTALNLQLIWQYKMLLGIVLEGLPGLAYIMVVELVGVKL